jgi:sodium transport system permease protein
MDTLAGERERRSLLPLLMNPLTPLDLILGKWLAVSLFASGGLAVNLASFGFIAARSGAGINPLDLVIFGACLLVPLALLAAALELAVSTLCRSVKEAHTYLSALVFAPMLLAMFLVFFPRVAGLWSVFTPLIGHQLMLDLLMRGGGAPLIPLLALGLVTAAATAAALRTAAEQLEREDVLYGV